MTHCIAYCRNEMSYLGIEMLTKFLWGKTEGWILGGMGGGVGWGGVGGWSRFIRLRIETSGDLLENGNEVCCCIKCVNFVTI